MSETVKNNSGESAEGIGEDGWSTLAEMSGKFNPDEARRLAEAEKTRQSEAANDDNSESASIEARTRIEEIFEEKERSEAESIAAESAEAEQSKELPIEAKPQTISDKYDLRERPRIDKIKEDLGVFTIRQYEKEQIASRPSTFRKAVRLMADKLGIKTKRSEKRRDGEAIYIALNEYREEEEAERRAAEERGEREAQERKR